MDAEDSKPLATFGFLTVVESPEHGLFGGYLVLSPQGRPLEFRCSTPVRPTRAQEILYGPTLRPYLLAEVIGAALLASAELPVAAILTDLADVLPLGAMRKDMMCFVERAVARELVREDANEEVARAAGVQRTEDATTIDVGGCRVRPASGEPALAEIARILAPLAAHVDLIEPFERIRTALAEAQQASLGEAETADDLAAAA